MILFQVYYPEVPMLSSENNKPNSELKDESTSAALQTTTTDATKTEDISFKQPRNIRATSLPSFHPSMEVSNATIDEQVRNLTLHL